MKRPSAASSLPQKEARRAAFGSISSTTTLQSSGDCWLSVDQPLALLTEAASPPWEGDSLSSSTYSTSPVAWECISSGPHWDHALVWCPVPGGDAVAIHRLSAIQPAAEPTLESVRALVHRLALEEMAASAGSEDGEYDAASNVGGYHGERDLCERLAVRRSALPSLLGGAVAQASRAEAAALRRTPILSRADEAWINALHPGGWNVLHTHEGSTYSGVLYIADGGCLGDLIEGNCSKGLGDRKGSAGNVYSSSCELVSQLAGRLAFVTSAPHETLTEVFGH